MSKWIDTEDLPRYTKYINDWHKFQKDMQRNLIEYMRAGEDETARNQTMLVLQVMYVGMYDERQISMSSLMPGLRILGVCCV